MFFFPEMLQILFPTTYHFHFFKFLFFVLMSEIFCSRPDEKLSGSDEIFFHSLIKTMKYFTRQNEKKIRYISIVKTKNKNIFHRQMRIKKYFTRQNEIFKIIHSSKRDF